MVVAPLAREEKAFYRISVGPSILLWNLRTDTTSETAAVVELLLFSFFLKYKKAPRNTVT